MAVPKRRTSSTKRGMRRSHDFKHLLDLSTCPECNQPMQPHVACPNCGMYNGRKVVDQSAKIEKKAKKSK